MSAMPRDDAALVAALGTEADPLTDDALTRDFRVWQRTRGHRYSLDDVLTASVAVELAPRARLHADLGCGLGSVLLMVAWRLGDATHLGVEAQAVSFELLTRNVARNGIDARVSRRHGDLRVVSAEPELAGRFELVTGTPPYVPEGRSTPAPDPQKAYARIEYRGGVEAYVEAMARLLTPDGVGVVCGDARHEARALDSAAALGLRCIERVRAVPREGSPPLFTVFGFARKDAARAAGAPRDFVARDAEGRRSAAYLALRAGFGLPGLAAGELASPPKS